MMSNPFVISGYVSADYFCDRIEETARLHQELADGSNVALIASRRIGKSGLIKHVFAADDVRDGFYTFYVDIYATRSLRELVYVLSREIVTRLKPHGVSALQKFWDYVRSLQAGISFSPSGEPSFNLQLGDIQQSENTLDEIFHYLQNADKPCIVAIDEFQQIASYPETNVEALLRTYVQQCTNARFIFSGSQRHTMGAMFTSASRPFFQSVSVMHLPPIRPEKYCDFASRHFERAGKHITPDAVMSVFDLCTGVTWYMQKMLNVLFARTAVGDSCTEADVPPALDYILSTLEYTYQETLFRMPQKQKEVFLAIAKEGHVRAVTSGAFIHKYHLPSASTVQSAVRGLLERDYLTLEQGFYSCYDLFFAFWIQRNF